MTNRSYEERQTWDKGMSKKRYLQLLKDETLELTEEEKASGWYFDWNWDGLLVHKSWPEAECD